MSFFTFFAIYQVKLFHLYRMYSNSLEYTDVKKSGSEPKCRILETLCDTTQVTFPKKTAPIDQLSSPRRENDIGVRRTWSPATFATLLRIIEKKRKKKRVSRFCLLPLKLLFDAMNNSPYIPRVDQSTVRDFIHDATPESWRSFISEREEDSVARL